ncbi:hypothetical protein GCM10020331_085050 [Ectobacillus funiculus]
MIMSNIDNLSNIGYLNNGLVKKSMQRAGRKKLRVKNTTFKSAYYESERREPTKRY